MAWTTGGTRKAMPSPRSRSANNALARRERIASAVERGTRRSRERARVGPRSESVVSPSPPLAPPSPTAPASSIRSRGRSLVISSAVVSITCLRTARLRSLARSKARAPTLRGRRVIGSSLSQIPPRFHARLVGEAEITHRRVADERDGFGHRIGQGDSIDVGGVYRPGGQQPVAEHPQ